MLSGFISSFVTCLKLIFEAKLGVGDLVQGLVLINDLCHRGLQLIFVNNVLCVTSNYFVVLSIKPSAFYMLRKYLA